MTVGKPRSATTTILVGIVTLGIGFFVYYFRAFREVDFHNGRRHSGALFLALLPFVGWIAAHIYVRTELARLAADRAKVGLVPTMTAGHHLMLVIIGLMPSILFLALALTNAGSDLTRGEPGAATTAMVWASIGLALLGPACAVPALSRNINEYWDAVAASGNAR